MEKKLNKPAIMVCYARSGGTLLNQILGVMPNTVVMSEVNPLGGGWGAKKEKSFTSIKEQANNWYGIQLKGDGFKESLGQLCKYCKANEKKLIIRDWSFINFTPHEYNNFKPPNRFLTTEEARDIKPKIFGLVRNGMDVWISRGCPELDKFSLEYLTYVKELKKLNCPIFKYEDLCIEPEKTIKSIFKYIGITFNKTYKDFHKFKTAHGDTQKNKKTSKIINKPTRKHISPHNIWKLSRAKKLKKANSLLGYNSNYFEE